MLKQPKSPKAVSIEIVESTHVEPEDRQRMIDVANAIASVVHGQYAMYGLIVKVDADFGLTKRAGATPTQGEWDFKVSVTKENPIR